MKIRWLHERYSNPPLNLTQHQFYKVIGQNDAHYLIVDDWNESYYIDKQYCIEQPPETLSCECEYGDY